MAEPDDKSTRPGAASVDVAPVNDLAPSLQLPPAPVPAPSKEALREQLDLLRIAVDEYRFNVNLGWDRSKYFIGLNLTILGGVAALARVQGLEGDRLLLILVLLVAAMSALLGAGIVQKSHEYYRNARAVVLAMQKALPESRWGFAISTTGGQGGSKSRLPKINKILIAALLGLVVFDLVAAIYVGAAGGKQPAEVDAPTPAPVPSLDGGTS